MINHFGGVSYYGTKKIKPHRMTLVERFKLWRRRRVMDDLAGVGT